MNDLEWGDFENLKSYGVQSISVDNSFCDNVTGINGDEFGALRIPNGPNYHIELCVDNTELKRLQEALKKEPRKPEDEIKHELKVMHDVNNCKGDTVREKIDNYFEKVDSKAKVCDTHCCEDLSGVAQYFGHYKIKHR